MRSLLGKEANGGRAFRERVHSPCIGQSCPKNRESPEVLELL